jgi:hypothetical protein
MLIKSATLYPKKAAVICPETRRTKCAAVLAMAFLVTLAGCGVAPGSSSPIDGGFHLQGAAGQKSVSIGLGGGQPALTHSKDGWLAAYVGTSVGIHHLFVSHSRDGEQWSTPSVADGSTFSDQSPRFVTTGDGTTHLYFASNRDGIDYRVFHSRYVGGSWSTPIGVDGTEGTSNLAVAFVDDHVVLATEILGNGLHYSISNDGDHFEGDRLVAAAGFEPALASLPDGRILLAYLRDGSIFARTGAKGPSEPEVTIVAGTGINSLREPALGWNGDHGLLAYTARTPLGYSLRAARFDANAKFGAAQAALPAITGAGRAPAFAVGPAGSMGLIWGTTSVDGQSNVNFATTNL